MNNKDKKLVDEQEKLLDHLIEYGGRQYIDEEIKKYEDLPELEPSKEFDDRMNRMFKDAYKKEVRHENIRLGKKIAVIAVAAVGVVSAAAMNIKAVREPVLNFVFHSNGNKNKTKINSSDTKEKKNFIFNYIPNGYKQTKKQYLSDNQQIVYTFESDNNQAIFIKIQLNQKYDTYTKLINDNYSEIQKNSKTYYFINGKTNKLLWYRNQSIFNIISTLPEETLIKIAQNIKLSK